MTQFYPILTQISPEGEQRMCHWKHDGWKTSLQGRITHPTLGPKENHQLKINALEMGYVSSQVTFQVLYYAGILQVAIFFSDG